MPYLPHAEKRETIIIGSAEKKTKKRIKKINKKEKKLNHKRFRSL